LLTADLVKPVSQGGALRVRALTGVRRARALAYAEDLCALARAHVGLTRGELDDALRLEVDPKDKKLVLGLAKLVEDRCRYEQSSPLDPQRVRPLLWQKAAEARREGPLRRDEVIAAVAAELEATAADVEAALFADLKAQHRLVSVDLAGAAELVERYDLGQAQAVLLRAVRVTARVGGSDPDGYRRLFHKLKFHRLLFLVQPDADGYILTLDGPLSLFQSVTKYGLGLALVLPALTAFPRCELEAEVRWGKERKAQRFCWSPVDAGLAPVADEVPARDEVTNLAAELNAMASGWRAERASALLHLPGAGVCVPDLTLTHEERGDVVYVEVLGFWSREAVWRRVELVERGLEERVLFAVSSRLRVSERALEEGQPAALYVYKGVMSARAVLEKVAALAAR
jgi:uncharacterized protein